MTNRRLLRTGALATFGFFLSSLLGMLRPMPVQARVDPLNMITRQIERPNILIVLDTSGSLTGVPGGTFQTSDEVGVDCRDGEDCRGGISVGVCASTGKECVGDSHCSSSTCEHGYSACASSADCPPAVGKCGAATATSCYTPADCPPLSSGTCQQGGTCNTKNRPCGVDLHCQYGGAVCSGVGTSCPDDGICEDGNTLCAGDDNCPYRSWGGTCSITGGACGKDTDCPPPTQKKCNYSPYQDCSTDVDCAPLKNESGTTGCTSAGMKTCQNAVTCCTKDSNCNTAGKPCGYVRKCTLPTNRCVLPHQTCTIRHSPNPCVDTNQCVLGSDSCSGGATNACVAGVTGDKCNAPAGATGARMCRASLELCSADTSCRTAGDSCGPASSRMSMAKHVLSDVVTANSDLANFGLMTYYQSKYFTYYPITSGQTTTTVKVELGQGKLRAAGCYSKRTGPATTCDSDGNTYSLRSNNNSRYLVKGNGQNDFKYLDANYCGWFCDIPGVGVGVYKGSYYDMASTTGSQGTPVIKTNYMGQSFTENGVTYQYMVVKPDYYSSGTSPPIEPPNCGGATSAPGSQLCEYSAFAIDTLRFAAMNTNPVYGPIGAANLSNAAVAIDIPNGGKYSAISCSGYDKGCPVMMANGAIDFHSVAATLNADVYVPAPATQYNNVPGGMMPSSAKTLPATGDLSVASLTNLANTLQSAYYQDIVAPSGTATYCMNGSCTDANCGIGSGNGCTCSGNPCNFTFTAAAADTPREVNIGNNNNPTNVRYTFKAVPNGRAVYVLKVAAGTNGPLYIDFDYTNIGTGTFEMRVSGQWSVPNNTYMNIVNGGTAPDPAKISWYFDDSIPTVTFPQESKLVGRIYAAKSKVTVGQNVSSGAAIYAKSVDVSNGVSMLPDTNAQKVLCTPAASVNTCGPKCGGRWDTYLAPFISTNPADQVATKEAIMQTLQPAELGGLVAWGGTPTGCTLKNDGAPDINHSAYHYMRQVKNTDAVTCRLNAVLLVTDGEANGPGDSYCSRSACAAADPVAAGCTCKSVLAAYSMRKDMGVLTYVVGFSFDARSGTAAVTNDNIARAGGTDANATQRASNSSLPYAFQATSEAELNTAIEGAVFQAIKGSYETSPATASSGTQQANSVTAGSYVLDSRVQFPQWEGTLIAYDVATGGKVWDAAAQMKARDWKTRNIFTSNSANQLVKFTVDASGNVTNRSALRALGLGNTDVEAENVARWLMNDPAKGGQAVLGSIVNSTPIDVGSPGDGTLPGQHAFFTSYKNRTPLTYVGADDGMLHAFFTKDSTLAGVTWKGGTEAFAYIPPDMLPVAARLYAQGGQEPDPRNHIYGLASSPKVKSVCVSGCDSASTATWKTVLVMTEGYGSNDVVMLDITNPFPGGALSTSSPLSVLWSSNNNSSASSYDTKMGLAVSVPGFYFNKTDAMDDYRVIFASGYPVTAGSTTQGTYLVHAKVNDGTIVDSQQITNNNNCTVAPTNQEFTVLTDVATAKDYAKDLLRGVDEKQKLLAAYVGDTWGKLWRYTPSRGIEAVYDYGCQHPLHFAPAVVQMDRDDPNAIHAHEIYLVQVTNSGLDPQTGAFQESKMTFLKEVLDYSGRVQADTNFGVGGKIEFQVGADDRMCASSDALGNCSLRLPSGTRPMGTPLAILKKDGSGFILLSNWWAPPTSGCGKGKTYMLIHDYYPPLVTLKQAKFVGDEPMASPVVVGGKVLQVGQNGVVDTSAGTTLRITVGGTDARAAMIGEPYNITGWTELP